MTEAKSGVHLIRINRIREGVAPCEDDLTGRFMHDLSGSILGALIADGLVPPEVVRSYSHKIIGSLEARGRIRTTGLALGLSQAECDRASIEGLREFNEWFEKIVNVKKGGGNSSNG